MQQAYPFIAISVLLNHAAGVIATVIVDGEQTKALEGLLPDGIQTGIKCDRRITERENNLQLDQEMLAQSTIMVSMTVVTSSEMSMMRKPVQ